jgi:cyclophilin family peptidyl-prolyl cis-trans isomerase
VSNYSRIQVLEIEMKSMIRKHLSRALKSWGLILATALCAFAPSKILAGTKVEFVTIKGTITIELFDEDKPKTVQNFIKIAESGYYQNTFFHRLDPDFVIQGGGYSIPTRTSTDFFTSYNAVSSFGEIENEYNVGRTFSNTYGTIAMARLAGQVDSATNQWFINLADNAVLDSVDGGFTVFGRVIRGFETLEAFQALRRQPSGGIVDLRTFYGSSATVFAELPVNFFGVTRPRYSDLFYVDIKIFKTQIELMNNGSRKISWESVANIPNLIEATDTLVNPTWSVIATRTGTGGLISVEDNRFLQGPIYYRVRLDYPL